MAIVLVNPAGNTPQGSENAQGDTIVFAPTPEPGPRHGDGVVLLYSTLPAVRDEHPASEVIQGNFTGTQDGPDVFVFAVGDQPDTPVGEDSRGLWQINRSPGDGGAHVAISLGDDGGVEAIVVSGPAVFDFLL